MSSGAKRLVGGLAVVAVLAPAFIWWEHHKKGKLSAEVKAETMEQLAKLGEDDGSDAYYQGLVEAFHETAFDGAYTMGGRRRSAKFDESKYHDRLFSLMAAKAREDGRAKDAAALQVARVSLLGAALEEAEAAAKE